MRFTTFISNLSFEKIYTERDSSALRRAHSRRAITVAQAAAATRRREARETRELAILLTEKSASGCHCAVVGTERR